MVEFKERISKNASNKHIFDPIKREKGKRFEDTVKRTAKTKINGKIKDIVEQKDITGLLAAKLDQSKLTVDIKNAMSFAFASVSLLLASADGAMRKAKKSNLYGAINSLSNHNKSLEIIDVNYLFVDVATALRAVKNILKTFEDLAIKLINDVPKRYNVVYFVCDTYFEKYIKVAERSNSGSSDRLVVSSSKMHISSYFQNFLNNNNNKERLFEIIKEAILSHNKTSIDRKIYFSRGSTCKLLSRGYADVTFTVNHEDADTKLICLVKHAIENDCTLSLVLTKILLSFEKVK